ncbi:MAG: D-alanine--D-alanine ligase, partial [Firmicutes bacterium]|nr:D-alanine--D-alanine ligase [Bacillota bacterium]
KNKYVGSTQLIPHAPSLNGKLRKEIGRTALKIHQTLNLGPMSRTDFIVQQNQPFVLEVNTIPGLTSHSLYPKAALAAGLNFEQLVNEFINLTLGGDLYVRSRK